MGKAGLGLTRRAMPDAAMSGSLERRAPRVRRLILRDFRSYAALDVRFDENLVAFVGENGAGKTNLLEALSLFSPGRGLRRAEIGDCARLGGPGGFSVAVEVEEDGEVRRMGLGLEDAQRTHRIELSGASRRREKTTASEPE